jgi:hypothetical protein
VSADDAGGFAIVAMIAIAAALAWYLVYVVKVEWFKQRLLHGNRHERIFAMLPIVVPLALTYWLIVRPLTT